MILCRVLGPVVATLKHPAFAAKTVLGVQPVRPDGVTPVGASFLAMDHVQAGEGDLVLVLSEGTGARQLFGVAEGPHQNVIVGIVDEVLVPEGEG